MSVKLSPFGLAAVAALTAGSLVVAGRAHAQTEVVAVKASARPADKSAGAAAAGAPRMPAAGPGAVALEMRPRRDVDESALRYYAAQKETGRVEAETRRVRDDRPLAGECVLMHAEAPSAVPRRAEREGTVRVADDRDRPVARGLARLS